MLNRLTCKPLRKQFSPRGYEFPAFIAIIIAGQPSLNNCIWKLLD